MYYWMREYFDDFDETQLSRSKNKLLLQNKPDTARTGYSHSSFGKIKVDSTSNSIYQWKLKLIGSISPASAMLGVSTSTRVSVDYIMNMDGKSYAYNGYAQKYINVDGSPSDVIDYGVTYGSGDIVGIILDLSKREISFSVNDEVQGVAFEEVECGDDVQYRLAVAFVSSDVSIQLIEFTTK